MTCTFHYKGDTFIAVPHERLGNERAWSVTGSSLALGQIVHLHSMCNAVSAIKKAIAQDNQALYVALKEAHTCADNPTLPCEACDFHVCSDRPHVVCAACELPTEREAL